MKIKAIAVDLDGTLLSSDKAISDMNKEVLKYLEKKGVKIFIVTGRTYVSAKPFVTELGIDSYIISYNGAKVVDYKKDRVIFELPLEEEFSKKIIELGKKKGFHINLYQDNKWYVENLESLETQHYAKHTGLTPIKKSFDTFEDYNMIKITIQDMNNSKEFNEFCNELKRVFGNNVYTAKSQKFLFEILNKNVNKGLILEKVLKSYGILLEECVAFGDANNDLEMLTAVGYGVAMGNSDLELKSKVKYVTDTNDNNGVAKFLKKYFF